MKTYIFLVRTISKIGGAELYLSSKIKFLEEIGWDCHVFFHEAPDKVLIPSLKKYTNSYLVDLRMTIANVGSKARDSTIGHILKALHCNVGDETIIESHTLRIATWGEYLAQKISAIHFVYFIDEHISQQTPQMNDFIKFKISQDLFYCIKEEVIADYVASVEEREKHMLVAVGCSENNVLDIKTEVGQEIPEEGMNIFSIGRMEKPYFNHMIDSVCNFADSHKENTFNFVIIGDTEDDSLKSKLLDKIKHVSNLKIYLLGYVWPIPRTLINKASVILASAGSVYMGYLENIPSIAIDSNDFEAIGVLGYNTTNVLFRTKLDNSYTINDYLTWILIEKKQLPLNRMIPQSSDYSKHMEIINRPNPQDYYNVLRSTRMIQQPILRRAIHTLSKIKLAKGMIARIRSIGQ